MQDIFDELYAKSKKGIIFNNLYGIIIKQENIVLAYREIKRNKGSRTAGVNGHTIEYWEKKTTQEYISYIQRRFQNFYPHKVKRKEIPKTNGKIRPLGIPTMEDRFIQQCIKQVLEPIVEAKFHFRSYGFRPNRSTTHAISEFMRSVNHDKLYWIVDMDIKGFFDNINHGKLLKQLWTLGIRDKRLLAIISKILKAEVEGMGKPTKGTPQGGILSPLLANVVLNELDWWLDSQWKSFDIEEVEPYYRKGYSYPERSCIYTQLRQTTNLKEISFVRYADDFKILCRNRKDANKVFHAVKLWLKDRLDLEINEEKSKVRYIGNSPSGFLGFTFIARKKGDKMVMHSHMTHEAQEEAIAKIKDSIREIKRNPTNKNVSRYNSVVLGLQNYYQTATHISDDMANIDYKVHTFRYNQLKSIMTYSGEPSRTYKKIYKGYNYKKIFVANTCLFPISAVKHKYPIGFQRDICSYTPEGRQKIHDNLKINMNILHYLMENPPENSSVELADNRISRYSAQWGKCGVSNGILEIGKMELHHIKPVSQGGTDSYRNLVWLTYDIHKLVHATDKLTIEKYLKKVYLDGQQLEKLNKLRIKVGNCVIEQ